MPTIEYGSCALGVDYSVPPYKLPPNTLADSSNVVMDDSGLPVGRGGSVKLNNSSLGSAIGSVHEFRSGASTRATLCNYSTKIAVYNSSTSEFDDKNTGLTSGKHMQWVNFAGKAISVNEGSDAPQYYQDTSTYGDLAGSPPNGLTIAEWANRVWFGGDSSNPALLTGSALNDPTDYSTSGATGYTYYTIGDSKDTITGLFGYFDLLLIGKRNNIYKMYGNPATNATTLAVEPLYSKATDNVGFTSPWAITQVGNDVLFLDGFDIKRLSGIQEYGDVAYSSIIPHFRDYLADVADKDYIQYTKFFHYKKQRQIWVSIPTGATGHYVFVIDYRFLLETNRYAIFPMGGITVHSFGGVENGEVVDIYYGDESGFVYQLDSGNNDAGDAIDRYFVQTFTGDNQINRKQFRDTEVHVLPEQSVLSMTPYYAVDLMNAAQIRTAGNYTAMDGETVSGWNGTGLKRKRLKFFGLSGHSLALKWRQNTVNQNFTFYPSTLNFSWKSKNKIV